MILVDTSIWVDHLRAGNRQLATFLEVGQDLTHPFVTGELALGRLRQRSAILAALADLPQARVATDQEVLEFIELQALAGLGIGYVDVHLLVSVALTGGTRLWTRDKRLREAADEFDCLHPDANPH